MEPEYAERYERLQGRHWWWRARERWVIRLLRAHRPPEGWPRALDVGYGPGLFFDRLGEVAERVEGLEPDPVLAEAAARRGRVHTASFDADFRPDHPYDLVTLLDVLEHLAEPVQALNHVRSLLVPGGALLLTVPALPALWTSHDELNRHERRYTRRSLVEEVESARLEVLEVDYFFHWTVPAKLVQRATEAVQGAEPKPPRIPPGPVNTALEWMTRGEQILSRSLPVPFGSSLSLMARR